MKKNRTTTKNKTSPLLARAAPSNECYEVSQH